jgi:glycosyltransferase involved in cell wall biosynthesis
MVFEEIRMKPLVSVIVPIYKVEKYLNRCVDSIIQQSYSNLEIILVNDGSPDNCGVICDDYAMIDERIRVIHKENGGLSDARNSGIDISQGRYITFIDSDDFIQSDYVKKMIDIVINEECDIVQSEFIMGKSDHFDDSSQTETIEFFNNKNVFYGRKLNITAWAKLYDSNLFCDIRFPIGKIYEDEYVTYKLAYKSKKIALISDKLYYYFQSPVSITRGQKNNNSLDFLEAYSQRINFFESRNENELVIISKKELAIRAIIHYSKARISDVNFANKMLEVFKMNFRDPLKSKLVSKLEKLLLFSFKLNPKVTSQIITFTKNK